MELRTDLAVEARELAGDEVGGIEYRSRRENGMDISRLRVKTHAASVKLHKEQGTYITVDVPAMTDNILATDGRIETVGREIRRQTGQMTETVRLSFQKVKFPFFLKHIR